MRKAKDASKVRCELTSNNATANVAVRYMGRRALEDLNRALRITKADTKTGEKEAWRNSRKAGVARENATYKAMDDLVRCLNLCPDVPASVRSLAARIYTIIGNTKRRGADAGVVSRSKRPDESRIIAAVGWVICGKPLPNEKGKHTTKTTISSWVKWIKEEESKCSSELHWLAGHKLGLSRQTLYELLKDEELIDLATGLPDKETLVSFSWIERMAVGLFVLNKIRDLKMRPRGPFRAVPKNAIR